MYHDPCPLEQHMMGLPSMEETIAEYRMAQMVFESRMQARVRMSQFVQQKKREQVQRLRYNVAPPAPTTTMTMLPVPVSPTRTIIHRQLVPAASGLKLLSHASTAAISDDSSTGDRSDTSSLDGSPGSNRAASPQVTPPRKIYIDSILDTDVLCGRGGRSNHHPGNKRYRRVISDMRSMYKNQDAKSDKTGLSRRIVDHVCQYGGRFIKKEATTGRYYVLTRGEARKKTSQALRESKTLKWTQ